MYKWVHAETLEFTLPMLRARPEALCCAWANTPCWKGKLWFCKLDLGPCKHAFWVSRPVHPCTNRAGAVCSPMQMMVTMRWWLLHMGNPPFSSEVSFSIVLWISRFSKPSPYFSPFFSTFLVFVSKTTCNFFRFITAVTVCSIIIISICFGPRHERICYWQFIVPTGQQYANN